MHPTSNPATGRVSNNRKQPEKPASTGISRLAAFTPRRMFTSRLSGRNAAILMMLCAPPLLLFAAMNVPALIFESPEQQAYFYFARSLNQELSSSFALWLAGLCLLFAMLLPAPRESFPGRER